MLRSTKREIKIFYNQFSQYETFQKNEGWATPQLLTEHIRPYLCGNERIIDVGCGPGLVGEELQRVGWNGTLIGADIAENRLREAKQKPIYKKCVVADADHLPFADDSFDFILSNAMVGLTGDKSVIEMYRLVKPNGFFACIAVEIINLPWCRGRFKKALQIFDKLPRAKLLIQKDFGVGYVNTNYNNEHYICFIYRKL